MKTSFSLLPEDNPFQDITIGSLLGWGSYGRVHRGKACAFILQQELRQFFLQPFFPTCTVTCDSWAFNLGGVLHFGCACRLQAIVVLLSDAGYWNGSLVAVKVLEQVAGDFNPRSSLEPLLHHRLSHPNIVAMFDVCTQVRVRSVVPRSDTVLLLAVPLQCGLV